MSSVKVCQTTCVRVLAMILVVFASSSGARADVDAANVAATLHLYAQGQQRSLNPLLEADTTAQEIGLLAYDTLLDVDSAGVYRPRLATGVPTLANGGISRDGKTITFKLRSGVLWHDGAPFTSADVAFTIAKINDPKVNIASRHGYDKIVRVATPDARTVVITLREPYAPFATYVGTQYPIVPKHLLEKSPDINRDPIGSHPIGTGPYIFKSWERGTRLTYTANPNYFAGKPKIGTVQIAEIPDQNTAGLQLRTHALDFGSVESSVYAQLRDDPELKSATEPLNDFNAYVLDVTRPILADVRVRRAISMAIDRETLAKKNSFGTGTAAYADLVAQTWKSPEPKNPYDFDVRAANALLDAAGWTRGASGIREKSGEPLHLDGIDLGGSTTSASIDVQVVQMLRDVGIDIAFKYSNVALYYDPVAGPLAKGEFDIAAFGFSANIDPANDELYTCAARAPNGFNVARYCSPEMDALQRASLTTLDPKRRAALVVKIEELAVRDVPYVFTYHTPFRLIWNPKLHRTRTNFGSAWYDINHWYFTS